MGADMGGTRLSDQFMGSFGPVAESAAGIRAESFITSQAMDCGGFKYHRHGLFAIDRMASGQASNSAIS